MKPPVCSRCDGTGFVLLDQLGGIDHKRVAVAFRCECSAGARLSSRFALAPPREGRPQLSLVPERRDVDG